MQRKLIARYTMIYTRYEVYEKKHNSLFQNLVILIVKSGNVYVGCYISLKN